MNSLILRTMSRLLFPMMLLFAVFILLRGHNDPGGGFIGGLIAASAFALKAAAFDAAAVRRTLVVHPLLLVGVGLGLAVASGALAAFWGRPFFTSRWAFVGEIGGAKLALGTPLLFDLAVFAIVLGAVVTVLVAVEEE